MIFVCLSCILLQQYCQVNVVKGEDFYKKDIKGLTM